ncbi:MAG: UDP-3-O-(3-hydroxymyristoyl)glucosamine N-acyltransferase [Candidatus Omnitrophota bacterium]|nr:UDP-3-O-(3-hydroxymyristoyl)glucosamine N-acyltransferase [Candidatus Omnitrophota bacterium]
MKIRELARLIEGLVEGNGDIDIKGLSGTEKAKSGDLTFAMDEERLAEAERSGASCVLTNETIRKSSRALIRVKNPKLSFLIIYNTFNAAKERESFIHPTAVLSDSAHTGKNVWIGANVSIEEGVKIGDNVIIEANSVIKKNCEIDSFCRIYPNVTLYEDTRLKKNVILHSGVVVGSDGFGYMKDKGKIYKFPQLGKVIIENDVEIGANTVIDRGSLSDTVIGSGTKIDNLCQIAHNVKIGKNVLMAAQCGISGSTVIGDNVTMAGQVGIADNITVGDNATIGGKSGVIGSIKKDAVVWGSPARPIAHAKRQMAVLSWLTKNFKIFSKNIKSEGGSIGQR